MIRIGPNEERLIQDVTNEISNVLNSVGLFYRVFYRLKSPKSIDKKLHAKRDAYLAENKKLQDVLGIRITVYFSDDENIAIDLVKKVFEEIPEAHSIDKVDGERFGPVRCNLIFRIPEKLAQSSSLFTYDLIDKTFEVQFRTVFSEGWHEIEHDLRYKCKQDWDDENVLSRQLNGQLATLESCDWTMLRIFEELAYKKYKGEEWTSFFRNIMRIRFADDNLSQPIINVFNHHKALGKELLKKDRNELIAPIAKLTTQIPLLMDNVLFVINRSIFNNEELRNLETPVLKEILDTSFNQ